MPKLESQPFKSKLNKKRKVFTPKKISYEELVDETFLLIKKYSSKSVPYKLTR